MKSGGRVWGVVFIVFGMLVLAGAIVERAVPLGALTGQASDVIHKIGNDFSDGFNSVNNVTETGNESFDATSVSKLVLNSQAGKVHITADPNAKQATVNYTKGVEIRTGGRSAAEDTVKQIQVKLQASGDAEQIDVLNNGHDIMSTKGYVNFDITVPPTMAIEVQNDAGEVVTTGLASSVTVHLNAGKIDIDGFKNSVDLHTNAGEVSFSNGQDIKHIDAESNAGAINATLPSNANLNLDAVTNVGAVNCNCPLSVEKQLPGSSVHGTIGSGNDGTVTLHTNAGAININQQ